MDLDLSKQGDSVTTPPPVDSRTGRSVDSDAVDLELAANGRNFIRCSCLALFVADTADEVKDLYACHDCQDSPPRNPSVSTRTISYADAFAMVAAVVGVVFLLFLVLRAVAS